MTPMNEGILYGIFFLFRFHDRKLSSPTRKSCTLPHCLTSGRYGRDGQLASMCMSHDVHMTSLVFTACATTHGMMWYDSHCTQIN